MDIILRRAIIDFLDQHQADQVAERERRDPPLGMAGGDPRVAHAKKLEARHAYRWQLFDMSVEQLLAARNLALREQDLARPFHHSRASADFAHFGRCALLTVDEGTALSLGKDPRIVTRAMVHEYLDVSEFARNYRDRLDLITRAVHAREIPEEFTPLAFLAWAHEYKIPVHDDFVRETFARGHPIKYWHDACQELSGALDAAAAENTVLQDQLQTLKEKAFQDWSSASEQIDNFERENARLKNELSDKPIQPKERASLITLVIGMAIDAYGYDPRLSRTATAREISEALQRFGISITDETVRKYLNEGSQFVDPADLETALSVPISKPKSA